jgi:large subunit ribosomal protein L10
MNREQKAAAIAQIAAQIEESDAIFAVDYRGLSVTQLAELRGKLRDAEATFTVVKNSLTERAAEQSGAAQLQELLVGPTALTFVRGDAAVAAKAIADYARATQLLPFKGGLMEGGALDVEQLRSLSRLPSREVLYGQLVGVVASPVSGLVRSLGALLGGLAVALGQVRQKMESGEIAAGAPAEAEAPAEAAAPGEGEASAEAEAEAAEPEAEAAAEASDVAPAEAEAETPAEAEAAEPEATSEPEDGGEPEEAEAKAGAPAESREAAPADEPEPEAEAASEEAPEETSAEEPAATAESDAGAAEEPQAEETAPEIETDAEAPEEQSADESSTKED